MYKNVEIKNIFTMISESSRNELCLELLDIVYRVLDSASID